MRTMTSEREAFEKWSRSVAGANVCCIEMPCQNSECSWHAWQARAHLAQPAQAVDVGAILEVVESHVEEAQARSRVAELPTRDGRQALPSHQYQGITMPNKNNTGGWLLICILLSTLIAYMLRGVL